ncbi:hypothetical protein [Granulicella arctica]|uniref:hypothetical protein n=1 Tax=Granulicella arctica TaxID=940613 RepID=UPI0021E0200F|nr:hypothetical protein [Granulicella arctica]
MQGLPQMQGERIDGSVAIDRALKSSSLTEDGKPFHALMEIGAQGPYSGQIEAWWLSPTKYRLAIASPKFTQIKVVNGDQVQEKDEGDYYPRWLENFALALLNPLPMANNFRGGAVMVGAQLTQSCLRRDDRPSGITDQMTWGQICFSGSEPRLSYILTFNDSMEFKDWKGFGKKQIARTYQTDVLDYQPVIGRLTKLEELKKPDDAMLTITASTPADQRISTSMVSTPKEESLVEQAPNIQWPTVREGKTDGYMIVYARTDRTGQVRETAKHNSDQPGLESFGMEQALRYKFKPLMVNGVAEQMEMPLVLHFTSQLADPLPILSVVDMKKQMVSCDVGALPPRTGKGIVVTIRISVNEAGKVTGMGPVGSGKGTDWMAAMSKLESCRFAPYVVNGKATYYKGDVELTAP